MNKKQRGARLKISERALIQRINRKLKQQDEQLRTLRGRVGVGSQDVGRYFVIDLKGNFIVSRDVDLEKLAREIGVIHAWEELEK